MKPPQPADSQEQVPKEELLQTPVRQQSDEEALLQAQTLRRIAGQAARLGGWAIDLDKRHLVWSDEVCAIHELPPGYAPTVEEGLSFYPPEIRMEVLRHMESCIREGTPYDFELPKNTAKGRRIWVRSIGEAVRDESGRIVRIQGAFQDITARKGVEQRLVEQAALLDNATDAITVCSMDWRITYWNKAAERLYGWTADEVMGQHLHEVLQVHPGEISVNVQQLRSNGVWKGELQKTTRQGVKLTIQASWTLLQDEEGAPKSIFTIETDISERRKVEEQLRQSQKMEAVGRLAGGIAHDFNNLLTVINGYSESVLDMPGIEPRLHDAVRMINEAGTRAAELTRQLLGFSRQSLLQPKILDLNAVVLETGKLLQRLIGDGIQFKTLLNPLVSHVQVDPGQMDQILMNLAINARDAMPQGGQLTIETSNVTLDADFAALHPGCKPGTYVLLEMSDTGTGMTPEILARIFEPFFTTKGVGKGSGLGLSMVFGIVQQSEGWVQVTSTPGLGSAFRVYLPALTASFQPQPAEAELLPALKGTETILLVEDEAQVRSLAQTILENLGYTVLTAVDGMQGLQLMQAHKGPLDLVLTDVTMPNLNGLDMVGALAIQRSKLNVLFMSGYVDADFLNHDLINVRVDYIQKPFTPSTLALKVRQVLDARQR